MNETRSLRSAAALAAAVFLLVTIAACAPAAEEDARLTADERPTAVVLNAPFPDRVPGAAEALQARLERRDVGVDPVAEHRARFLESRRNLVGEGAPSAAAGVARAVGADLAVGVAARTFERELIERRAGPRERVALQLEAFVIRADGGAPIRISSSRYRETGRLREAELPDVEEDPIVARLRDEALDELAPLVAEQLRGLLDPSGRLPARGIGGEGER